MYTHLAHLYDWPGSHSFSTDMAKRICAFLSEQNQSKATILDVACGTGDLAIALTQHGYSVTGIDLSEAMLAIAQEKKQSLAPRVQDHLTFHNADMRELSKVIAEATIDVVLCTCDSLNHLTELNDLSTTFEQISICLKPQGWFLFDTNTLDNYTQFWQGKDTYEGPNYQLRAESTYDPDTERARITYSAFEHVDDGSLVEYNDTVDERFYSDEVISTQLAKHHLSIHKTVLFNPPEIEALVEDNVAVKKLWICQKQA